jgi:hypothetical protein
MTFRVCRTKRASMFQCRSAVDVMLQFSMNLKRKTKLRINTILDSTAWKYSNFGAPWGPPGASLEPTGGLLASSSRFPGACWVPPGGLSWGSPGEVPGSRGGVLGTSWGLLGALWEPPEGLLKVSWKPPVGLLGPRGAFWVLLSWEPPGVFLGASWGPPGSPLGPPGGLTIGPGTRRVSRLHPTSVKFLTVSRLTVWRHALTRNCARPRLPPGRARNHEKHQFP